MNIQSILTSNGFLDISIHIWSCGCDFWKYLLSFSHTNSPKLTGLHIFGQFAHIPRFHSTMSACIISSTIFQFMNKGSPYLATSIVPLICTNCRMFKTLKVRNCHCFVYLSPVCVLEFRHNSCVAAARPRWEDERSVDHRTVREWGHRGDTCCTCTRHQSPATALRLQIPESR